MKQLSLEECAWVSGGHSHSNDCGWGSSCPTTVDDVIVRGGGGGGSGSGGFYPPDMGGGSGGSTGGVGGADYDDPDCTCGDGSSGPEPDTNTQKLHHTVQYLSDIIRGMDINLEHAALIYKMPDGTISYTNISTGTNTGTAPLDTRSIPNGATLVGWIHSHPSETGTDQRYPSDETTSYDGIGDWQSVDRLIAAGAASSRFDVDPNMLTFIIDNASGKTFEYDINDRDQKTPGEERDCPIH